MKKIVQMPFIILGFILLFGCAENKENIVKKAFEDQVNQQSQGAITVDNFNKTDGKELSENKYEIEFKADVSFTKESWKSGNNVEGWFGTFSVMAQAPQAGWNSYLAGDVKHFNVGDKISLAGEAHLEKKESGWSCYEIRINTTQRTSTDDTTHPSEKKESKIEYATDDRSGVRINELVVRDGIFYFKNEAYSGRAYMIHDKSKPRSNTNWGAEQFFKDGKLDGTRKEYNERNQLISESVYKDGKENGARKTYYETNGQVQSESYYENGKFVGPSKQYFENGQVRQENTYIDGNPSSTKTYYESGQVEQEELKENDKLILSKSYYLSGKIKNEIKFEGNAPVKFIKYGEDGSIKSEEIMRN